MIELYITFAVVHTDNLFDYNSNSHEDNRHFKAMKVNLFRPKDNRKDYYFFHKHKTDNRQKLEI
jgi:hypothetical protein